MNKNALYLTFKAAALAAVLAKHFAANTVNDVTAVSALAFCCLFLTDFLINRLCRAKRLRLACAPIIAAACFFCGVEEFFPLLITSILEALDLLETGEYFYRISAVAALLAAFIFTPDPDALISAELLTALWFFSSAALERLEYFRAVSEEQRLTISSQSVRINELRTYLSTLRETSALEERGRFSARIHDRLGHGISGSVILLESAKLKLKTDPEQAKRCLETAVENLRGSVDSIREALREERPKHSAAGEAELREMLERFSLNYGLKTNFSIEGSSEKIPFSVWNCLKDNLTEALTNTVKHSDAREFTLGIRVYNKLIRAEFSDNGSAGEGISKGMGLDGVESRTVICGGKCLFQSGAAGFKIINVFEV